MAVEQSMREPQELVGREVFESHKEMVVVKRVLVGERSRANIVATAGFLLLNAPNEPLARTKLSGRFYESGGKSLILRGRHCLQTVRRIAVRVR